MTELARYLSDLPNINGNTALHWAVSNDDVRVIDTLVDAGADVDRRNSSGFTPLHHAVLAEQAAAFSALTRRGANPNALVTLIEEEDQMHDCTGCNSIHLLVDSLKLGQQVDASNFRDLLRILVGAGTDINARIKRPSMYEGYSALRLAVEGELDLGVVEVLIELGAGVEPDALHAVFSESFQYSGKSAGSFRYRSVGSAENLRVLRVLLESGIDISSRDSCGRTVLHKAASFAHKRSSGIEKAVAMLIVAGADVDARTEVVDAREYCGGWGLTPLHEVAKWGGEEDSGYAIALMLVEAGADPTVRNGRGKTAGEIANIERMKGLLSGLDSPDVAQAYVDHSRDVSKGLYIHFDSDDVPDEKDRALILDIAEKSGFVNFKVATFEDLTVWHFEFPYWKFDEEVDLVCREFPDEIQERWKECGFDAPSAWPIR